MVVSPDVGQTLKEMHSLSNLPVAAFIGQLLQCAVVEFRRLKVRPSLAPASESQHELAELHNRPAFDHRVRLSRRDRIKIFTLYRAGMKITEIAKRMNCCTKTVRTILKSTDEDDE